MWIVSLLDAKGETYIISDNEGRILYWPTYIEVCKEVSNWRTADRIIDIVKTVNINDESIELKQYFTTPIELFKIKLPHRWSNARHILPAVIYGVAVIFKFNEDWVKLRSNARNICY